MTKARDLANLISTGNPLSDGAVAASEVSGLHAVATSGAYANLTGTPTLATVATSGAYADVTGTPSLATVATSGAYSDLSGSPSGDSLLPSQTNNSGKFLTSNGSAASWADAGGGAHSFITKIEVTTSNSGSLTIGSSYVTSSYNDYYFDLLIPNHGWASPTDYQSIHLQLQYNDGNAASGPNGGKFYRLKPHPDVGYGGNGTQICESFRAFAAATSSTPHNKRFTNHIHGKILNTQDVNTGARAHTSFSVYSSNSNFINGFHNSNWYSNGTNTYKIIGMKFNTDSGNFPVGTKLYLYGINRS